MRPICLLSIILACAGCGRHEASVDVPFAWEQLDSPAGPGSGESHLAVARDGTIVMSWLEPDGEGHALRYATLSDSTWSAPRCRRARCWSRCPGPASWWP